MRGLGLDGQPITGERRINAAEAEVVRRIFTLRSMLQVIGDSGYTRGMTDRMRELEACEDELNALLMEEASTVLTSTPASTRSTGARWSAQRRSARWRAASS